MPHKIRYNGYSDATYRRRKETPPQHRKDVLARAPKRTPRLSEAEKREARRKRRERVRESGLPASRLNMTDAQINAEYQRLADDEVKRASEVVRATPRDTARRRTRSTTRHAPGRGL